MESAYIKDWSEGLGWRLKKWYLQSQAFWHLKFLRCATECLRVAGRPIHRGDFFRAKSMYWALKVSHLGWLRVTGVGPVSQKIYNPARTLLVAALVSTAPLQIVLNLSGFLRQRRPQFPYSISKDIEWPFNQEHKSTCRKECKNDIGPDICFRTMCGVET